MLTMTPLRRRLIEDLQLRNRSPKTIEVYVYHVRELARYCRQSPAQLADEPVHRYLLYLLHDKRVSWSSYNQAVAALRFFYRVTYPSDTLVRRLPYGKRPKRLPVVRSPQQVACFLGRVSQQHAPVPACGADPSGPRAVPHLRAGRARYAVRSLWRGTVPLSFLRQPKLSSVWWEQAGGLAGQMPGRSPARALLSRRLHLAP